ncbi:MAG: ABC transporter substrate-binding protein [Anaerolineales bacterium]
MKKLRWQLLVVLLALAAITFLLLNQQAPVLPGVVDQPNQPTTGGVYSEALIGSFGRLNPLLDYYNSADQAVDRLIYSGLIRFDDQGIPQGDLADSWGISQDGKVYNFSLRSDAVWQDGQPVTSDDVIFTIDQLRDDKSPLPSDIRDFWKQVDVKALDSKTLQFRLPEAFAPFMDYLAFGVLPKHKLANLTSEQIAQAPFNMQPVGSGPFQFDRLIVQNGQIQGVTLTRFDKYYGKKPFIDGVTFRYYKDSAAALDAYDKGDVLGVSQVTTDVLQKAMKEPNLNLYTGRLPRLALVYLNLGNDSLPFFQDASIRRALLMGINRQWIVDRLLGSQAIVADGPIFPGTWAYYEGIEHLDYDPDAAISILKKAGYTIPAQGGNVRAKEDTAMKFDLVYPDQGAFPDIAKEIQKNWKELGVEVSLKGVAYSDLVKNYLEPRTYEAALVDLNFSRSPDPDPYPFWHQTQITGGQNYAKWDDRQASEYLEQARITTDLGERAKRYRNFQVRFTNEMPALPLYYPVYTYGVDAQVKGVRMGPLFDPSDRFSTITAWYFQEQRATQVPQTTATATP